MFSIDSPIGRDIQNDGAELLTAESEADHFRKLRAINIRAIELQAGANPADHTEADHLAGQAVEVRNQIIRANLRLVLFVAGRRLRPGIDFAELVSEGNAALIRCVELFDLQFGVKFGTYAFTAIDHQISLFLARQRKHRSRFASTDMFDDRVAKPEVKADVKIDAETVRGLMRDLPSREREIIESHCEGETLETIGNRHGITRERARQLKKRGLQRLRGKFAVG